MEPTYDEKHLFYLAITVIVLTILAIIVFIYSGGSYIFYAVALITIAIGFYMSYYGSKINAIATKPKQKTKKRGK
ncbi:MAG: hypothetical protein RXR32_01945 [Candidatus Micrarchaeota archaeon]